MNKDYSINNARVKINAIELFIPQFILSMSEQTILSNQIFKKIPTEPQYVERSVFMQEVNTQKLWIFELETQEGVNIPIWIVIGFQQRERQDSQNLNNDTFHRLSVTSAQCITSTEKYLDSAILLNYDDDAYSQV